ncbi:MAG: hypothetical protein NT077_03640 [Candidatus Taylorbacteria bacterium]|nr:hypothetical protein [Candidatus Taylorbacteria bacterium]
MIILGMNGNKSAPGPTNSGPINPFNPKPIEENSQQENPALNPVLPPDNLPGAVPVDSTNIPPPPTTPKPVFTAPQVQKNTAWAPLSPTTSSMPTVPFAQSPVPPAPPRISNSPVPSTFPNPPRVFTPPTPPRPPMPPVPPIPQKIPTPPASPVPPPTSPSFTPFQQTPKPISLTNAGEVEAVPPTNNVPTLKNIRTYESDVADVLAHRGSSKTSIAIAESARRGEGQTLGNAPTGTEPSSSSHFVSKLLLVLISLILIGAGVIGGYYLYAKSPLGTKPPEVIETTTPQAIIPFESQAIINIDGLNKGSILNTVKAEMGKPQKPSSVKDIVLTETKEGVTYRASALEMAYIMEIGVPDIISRTLVPEWMLGIYTGPDGSKSAFVIAKTNLFQNAFSGMLAWENAIPENLKNFITSNNVDEGTFTPAPKGTFKDQIVKNKDVRAFVTENEQTLLVYSFIDNSTLVVAANNDVLGTIISRLENKAFVR